MFFKRIELHGFKSFAEPTVIEFDRGITCIVGPNGSGKSNICDAIRWVLGAQSAKALRGDKMEDVIFAGTAARKSRGMAEVTLVIDNTDGELAIDYNEVAITRRMYRSGESEYLINNNQCRMKDIRELIMDTGIGVEGYSIIGQGKISDIISNNTESIREILEETAGIVMYRSRKQDSERKLASASQNMDRVTDIIGEIEGRIGKLKEDSEKATRYLELKGRHRELEINLTLRNIESIKEKNKDVLADIEKLSKDIDVIAKKREELSEKISGSLKERQTLDDIIEERRSKLAFVTDELSEVTSRSQVRAEKMAAMERESGRLRTEIEEIDGKIASEMEDSARLFDEKKEWDEKLEKLRAELATKTEEHEKLTAALAEKTTSVDDKKNELFDIQKSISAKEMEKAGIENLAAALEKRENDIEEEKGSGEDSNRGCVDHLEKAEKRRSEINRKMIELKDEKNELKDRLESGAEAEKKLTAELEDIRLGIGQAGERKRAFEEMEANYEGYNNAVRSVMRSGQDGIMGTVAELIDAEQGFEIAMETALGASMQHIICRDDDTAKKAIERLKAGRKGRATFLPVSSIRSRGVLEDEALEKMDGFMGYAVDRLSCDEELDEIAEYLVGNIIVTKDMTSAIAMSKKSGRGFKFVTVEGEVITAGGSITGGRHKHDSANMFERKADIRRLEEKIASLESRLAKGEADLQKAAEEEESIRSSITEKEAAISDLERESFANDNEINILRSSIDEFETSSERWDKELEDISKEKEQTSGSAQRLEEEIIELRAKAKALETEIEDGSEEQEEERARIEESQAAITDARLEVGACENEKAKADAVVSRIESQLAAYEEDKAHKIKELEAIREEGEKIVSSHDDDDQIIGEKETEKKSIEEELASLTEERKAAAQANEEDQTEKDELDRKALALSNQKNELDIRQARQDTQLENAKNKLWEEFDISYAQALDLKRDDIVVSQATRENREIKSELRAIGEVNVGAIEEYKTVSERYEFLTSQREDIEKSMNELTKIISDMDRVIHARFKESFDSVVANFEEVFRELYGGGHAKITLADESDPFESEIEITAQPPGKQLKHINLLSGGEKTMTAIALMFAVLKTKPTPCCILDEIEAALDDSNLDVFGTYLKDFEGVQFTLITHQKQTMQHADVMYGITMPEGGVSKVYSLRMEDAAEDIA